MTLNVLARNDQMVQSLADCLSHGLAALDDAPRFITLICNEGMWREREIERTHRVCVGPDMFNPERRWRNFEEFATTSPLEGLGVSIEALRRACKDDVAALDALDRAIQVGQRQGERTDLLDNIQEVSQREEAPTGTSAERAIRKLRKDAPALHARVLAGELSPHAAMVQAGYRKPSMTVPLEPEAIARALARRLAPADLATLIRALVALAGE